jgi:hypothetical protein
LLDHFRSRPGDVIATGTPAGVGFTRKPPVFLKPGDVVEVEIENIGVLRNPSSTKLEPRMTSRYPQDRAQRRDDLARARPAPGKAAVVGTGHRGDPQSFRRPL